MTEHVFRASDSESAMDKAIRELGDDAMILSVTRVGEMTEVRAMKESLVSVGRRPSASAPFPRDTQAQPISLSEALRTVDARRNGEMPQDTSQQSSAATASHRGIDLMLDGPPRSETSESHPAPVSLDTVGRDVPDVADLPDTSGITLGAAPRGTTLAPYTPEISPKSSSVSLPVSAPMPPSDAPQDTGPAPASTLTLPQWEGSADASASSLPSFEMSAEKPSAPMTLTTAQEAPSPSPLTAPLNVLAQNGFAADIVRASTGQAFAGDADAQLEQACTLLAERLALPDGAPGPLEKDITVVFGPPGAGKTTAAARLAFEHIQSGAHRPVFVQLRPHAFVEDDKLARHAQLLGISVTQATPDAETRANSPLIVDCNLSDPERIIDAVATLQDAHPDQSVQPVLALPGTWSTMAIREYCTPLRTLTPAVIITQMHIGGIGIPGLTALSEQGARLLAATDNTRISDGLTIITAKAIADFVRNSFDPAPPTSQLGRQFA